MNQEIILRVKYLFRHESKSTAFGSIYILVALVKLVIHAMIIFTKRQRNRHHLRMVHRIRERIIMHRKSRILRQSVRTHPALLREHGAKSQIKGDIKTVRMVFLFHPRFHRFLEPRPFRLIKGIVSSRTRHVDIRRRIITDCLGDYGSRNDFKRTTVGRIRILYRPEIIRLRPVNIAGHSGFPDNECGTRAVDIENIVPVKIRLFGNRPQILQGIDMKLVACRTDIPINIGDFIGY